MFSRRVVSGFAAIVATVFLAVLPGCGWLSGSGSTSSQSPVISSLSVAPSSVLCDQQFNVAFSYSDPQGDIARARVTFQRSGDPAVREETPLWPATSSRTTGTVSFPFTFACDSKGGVWTITVLVEDDKTNTSNSLTGEIRLNAAG